MTIAECGLQNAEDTIAEHTIAECGMRIAECGRYDCGMRIAGRTDVTIAECGYEIMT